MSNRVNVALFAVLLLVAACAPLPAPPSSVPATQEPTAMAPATLAPATLAPAASGPPALAPLAPTSAAASAASAPAGWQTYTNAAGFSISFPPGWTVTPAPAGSTEPLKSDVLDGPAGTIQLDYGQGFGGACFAYSALHLAQGQISACHSMLQDGRQQWSLDATAVSANTGVAGFAGTKDATGAGAGAVLAILATLAFETPPAQASLPPTAAGEIVVDNAGPDFWPKGDWYYLETDQKYGQDCYEALPGLTATAEVRPDLPQAGTYEVFAWSCGNPHYTQSDHGMIEVYRSAGDTSPGQAGVNYQTSAGEWLSLGTYNLEPGAFLKVRSVRTGNVVADAFRFVPQPNASGEAVPTPLPTGLVTSNHPPSPEQQVTSGDLAARLGVTGSYYQPITMTYTETTFDDCQAFPREGCSGTRNGFQAIVAYETITLTYKVSSDYKLVAIEGAENALDPWLMGQDHPQRVFLSGLDNVGAVHYYPNGAWRLLRGGDGRPDSDVPLAQAQAATLQNLAPKYSTLYVPAASGKTVVFYGFGPAVAPTDEDRKALLALADELNAMPW